MALDDEYIKPEWALGPSRGIVEDGLQLCTRDGRRIGNALVCATLSRDGYLVVTDMGTNLTLCTDEIDELFYRGAWLCEIDTHLSRAAKHEE